MVFKELYRLDMMRYGGLQINTLKSFTIFLGNVSYVIFVFLIMVTDGFFKR